MSSILVFNDPHLADNPPASRRDTYRREGLDMLREIVSIANYSPSIEAVVCTGDMFHVKAPHRTSHALVGAVIDILRGLRVGPVVIAPGNHDMGAGGWDAIPRQPLGILIAAGMVTVHSTFTPHFFINPLGYSEDMDTDPGWYRSTTITNAVHLQIAHGSVVPDGTDREFPTIPASVALAESTVDILAAGHIHEDLGVHTYDGKVFLNIGALGRTARTKANMTRTIKVAIVGSDRSVLELPLSSALPAEEAFVDNAPVVETEDEGIADFVRALAEDTTFEQVELDAFIHQVCEERGVGPEIEARLRAVLEVA